MNRIKYIFGAMTFFFLGISIAIFFYYENKDRIGYIDVRPGESKIYVEDIGISIKGWDNYGVTYFFIPSYARISAVNYDRSELGIYSLEGDLLEHPIFNTIQEVLVDTDDGGKAEYRVGFYQSDNLYTINLMMDKGDFGDIVREKYEPIDLDIVSPNGNITSCEDTEIKGRGNYSWGNTHQQSYEIRFSKPISVSGLTKARRYALIPNSTDQTKLCNKIAFDVSSLMGMEYTPEADWIDVYVNGIYHGNYLICQEPDISKNKLNIGDLERDNEKFWDEGSGFDEDDIKGYEYSENPDDISGGYLIEADNSHERRKCGFHLSSGVFFNIKSPDNASRAELNYIRTFINSVDNRLHYGDLPFETIDKFSFARRYLIEEVMYNYDACYASYYFYKKRGDPILYAGPCWDYDASFINKEGSILENDSVPVIGGKRLDWDRCLMENCEYEEYVKKTFERYAEIWDRMLSFQIDKYYERLSDSLDMQYARWNHIEEDSGMVSQSVEPEILKDELKMRLYTRLCYLADKWDVDYEFTNPRQSTY